MTKFKNIEKIKKANKSFKKQQKERSDSRKQYEKERLLKFHKKQNRRLKLYEEIKEFKEMIDVHCCGNCHFLDHIEGGVDYGHCGESEHVYEETFCLHESALIKTTKDNIIRLPIKHYNKCKYYIHKDSEAADFYETVGDAVYDKDFNPYLRNSKEYEKWELLK